jgi:hypothetical protein
MEPDRESKLMEGKGTAAVTVMIRDPQGEP